MIDVEMNTIEEEIINKLVDVYMKDENIPYLSYFKKSDVVANTKYTGGQVQNALQRLRVKGYIWVDGKEWRMTEKLEEIIIKESRKKELQQGLFPTENKK